MTPTRRFREFAVLALVLAAGRTPAADPTDDVLRLVPADSTLVVVVQNAREHGKTLQASPFAAWFPTSGVGKKLVDPKELEKLRAAEQFLTSLLGVSADDLRDDVFGDAVAFAYKAGPADKPDDEAGLVLVRPRKPAVLAKLIGKLNDLQTQSGELKGLTPKTHRDRPYTSRDKPGGGADFYAVVGDVVAYSAQERVIRAVLERDAAAPPAAKEPPPLAAALKRLGVRDKFAVVWVNPREHDAAFAARAAADPAEKAVLEQVRTIWAAADGVALYAHPAKTLEIGVAAGFRDDKVPGFVPVLGGPSDLWGAVPDDAIFATCGRVELPKLIGAVGAFLSADARKEMTDRIAKSLGPVFGKDRLPAVLNGVGPDFGVWVTPPAGAAKTWVPGVTAAVKVRADAAKFDLPKAVLQACELAAQFVRVTYNTGHDDQIELAEETRGGVTVKHLANDAAFPPGFRPAFGFRGDYLVVATTPDLVFRFAPPKGAFTGAPPVLRLSATAARAYLLAHGGGLAKYLGGEKPAKDLADLAAVLELFDRVEVRATAGGGTLGLSVVVDFAKPLAK